jgi:hypothetical protein
MNWQELLIDLFGLGGLFLLLLAVLLFCLFDHGLRDFQDYE